MNKFKLEMLQIFTLCLRFIGGDKEVVYGSCR
jgi:hypothetical protein